MLGKCCACDVSIPSTDVINFDQFCRECRAMGFDPAKIVRDVNKLSMDA